MRKNRTYMCRCYECRVTLYPRRLIYWICDENDLPFKTTDCVRYFDTSIVDSSGTGCLRIALFGEYGTMKLKKFYGNSTHL